MENSYIGLGNYAAAPHTSAPKVILSSSDERVISFDIDGKSFDKSQRDVKPMQNIGYIRGYNNSLKTFPSNAERLDKCNLIDLAKKLLIDRYLEADKDKYSYNWFRLQTPLGDMEVAYPGNESGEVDTTLIVLIKLPHQRHYITHQKNSGSVSFSQNNSTAAGFKFTTLFNINKRSIT